MSSTMFHCILVLLSLVSSVSPFPAVEAHGRNILTSPFSMKRAEKLIRGFNLSPSKDINVIKSDPLASAPKIIEKSFRFPNLGGHGTAADANGTSIEDFGHHAGYLSIPNTKGVRMFYLFFESRSKNKDAPVVIWLTGGPGCSSSLALFYENGPFQLANDLSLKWNDFGWDKESNLIFVDQPIGTGFSYSTTLDDVRSTSVQAGVDFFEFLQAFLQKHPEYAKNDLFITGESYAGHYIPAFAAEIQRRNKNNQGVKINLKGIAIGNGFTNPGIQDKADADYALDMKLIDQSEYNALRDSVSECEAGAKSCGDNNSSACNDTYNTCSNLFSQILSYADPNINYYDIRKKCQGSLCYDFSSVDKFLNQNSVKKALGVGDIEFVSCSLDVYIAMQGTDWMRNYALVIPGLLQDGVKVLIYAGEYDLICNWLGNSRWVDDLKWPGYSSAPFADFIVDNKKYGQQKGQGLLTFLKFFNAGHLVPMDQPKASLEMLRRWTQGKPL